MMTITEKGLEKHMGKWVGVENHLGILFRDHIGPYIETESQGPDYRLRNGDVLRVRTAAKVHTIRRYLVVLQ